MLGALEPRFSHLSSPSPTNLGVKPGVKASAVKAEIQRALERSARLDAAGIQVVTHDGGRITLRGQVSSLVEKDEAEDAAWATPGVTEVENELRVSY